MRPTKNAEAKTFRWRIVYFVLFALFLMADAAVKGRFGRVTGITLLLGFVVYALISIRSAEEEEQEEGIKPDGGFVRPLVTLVVCAALLFEGANLLVDNGILLAQALHVPERVIAVTFIALGTSLPELVTAINALIKGYEDVSLGNIIGANLLNLLLDIGIPAAIRGIPVTPQVASVDIPLGIGVMLLLAVPILVKKRGYRWQGALLLVIYGAYCVIQL